MPNIRGLSHWSFINLFKNNETTFKSIYDGVRDSIVKTTKHEPSVDDLKRDVFTALLNLDLFIEYCQSKNTFNPNWTVLCAEAFAEYIVSIFYNQEL
jgi:hypothetical protein